MSWTELIKRTIKEANADNVLGLAAQLAYYFLLALVPAIVFLIALTSFFPPETIDRLVESAARVMPGDMMDLLREQLDSLRNGDHGGVLSFGLLAALWSSSAALVAVTDALNRAYDIEEGRPWWKVRLIAIALTIGLALFVLSAFTLVVAGPELAETIAARVGLGGAFTLTWKILQWPVVFALVVVAIGLINYYAPDAEQDWVWITPGAFVATVLWLLASLAFRFYVTNFGDYNATYGSLGGVIVLMLWFYISSLAILIGAEMNAEIEHASPYGKDPGEKVPGEKSGGEKSGGDKSAGGKTVAAKTAAAKKKIGMRAKRAWEEARRHLPQGAEPATQRPTR